MSIIITDSVVGFLLLFLWLFQELNVKEFKDLTKTQQMNVLTMNLDYQDALLVNIRVYPQSYSFALD